MRAGRRLILTQTVRLTLSLLAGVPSVASEAASRHLTASCVIAPPEAQPEVMVGGSASVRSLNPRLLNALREGLTRSQTLRGLVAILRDSDVIVYLEEGACGDAVGCTVIASASRERRILRTRLRLRTPHGPTTLLLQRSELIVQIAHELQHAVEISNARSVVDEPTLAQLYAQIGHPGRWPSTFESDGAIAVGDMVRVELAHPLPSTSNRSGT
jgi:hypothetical protein